MGVNSLVAGEEDRAPQGCDLSADPGAEIGRERASLAPLLQAHLGTKAINPGGLGAKPPALPASPSFIGFHKTFDTTGQDHELTTERTETTEKSAPCAGRVFLFVAARLFLRLFSVTSVASVVRSFWTCCRLWRHAEFLPATEDMEAKSYAPGKNIAEISPNAHSCRLAPHAGCSSTQLLNIWLPAGKIVREACLIVRNCSCAQVIGAPDR